MKFELQNLNNKAYLLTGGTFGIRKEIVDFLIEFGSKILINARNISTVNEITHKLGNEQILNVASDCAEAETTDKMVSSAISHWGKIDGVIANAGIVFYESLETI
jgi:NADP-dependent 3-hydroxy acid dehydrogenase YdfG